MRTYEVALLKTTLLKITLLTKKITQKIFKKNIQNLLTNLKRCAIIGDTIQVQNQYSNL